MVIRRKSKQKRNRPPKRRTSRSKVASKRTSRRKKTSRRKSKKKTSRKRKSLRKKKSLRRKSIKGGQFIAKAVKDCLGGRCGKRGNVWENDTPPKWYTPNTPAWKSLSEQERLAKIASYASIQEEFGAARGRYEGTRPGYDGDSYIN